MSRDRLQEPLHDLVLRLVLFVGHCLLIETPRDAGIGMTKNFPRDLDVNLRKCQQQCKRNSPIREQENSGYEPQIRDHAEDIAVS